MYHTQALQDYQHVFKTKTEIADEEVMVVALTGGLRIEQPFTKDRESVVRTLRRMEHDISLWNGNFSHLTETPLFRSLGALVTVLRMSPGPKAVVFVSAGSGPSGEVYDLDFDRLAAAASDAQVSFYTVDCMGLFATTRGGQTGGPRGLARLASMTGGRLTRNSNDPTVGYARARRDLGCRYTVGFYDSQPEADKQHQISVNSRREGVRLIYAARYSVPSEQTRRRQALDAVFLVPQQFDGGGLRAHVFPLQPQDAKLWNAALVVDFPVELPHSGREATREFGVVLQRGTDILHTFNRSISVSANDEDSEGDTPRVTFVEPVTLPPGNYALTAVLVLAEGDMKPFGHVADLTVPPLPKREAILTGPVLGRRRGNDVVVYGGGDAKGADGDRLGARDAFRPMLIDEVDRREPLAALTNACVFRPKANDGPWSISRSLETASGEPAGSLADVTFKARARIPLQCESLLDELPVQQLKPGPYTFRAVLAAEGSKPNQWKVAVAPFLVSDPPPPAPAKD
jgi:hypothetical protein